MDLPKAFPMDWGGRRRPEVQVASILWQVPMEGRLEPVHSETQKQREVDWLAD
jgi:hypothetical protein